VFLDGVGPDSSDAQIHAIVDKHPAFEVLPFTERGPRTAAIRRPASHEPASVRHEDGTREERAQRGMSNVTRRSQAGGCSVRLLVLYLVPRQATLGR
jgi:hypothetical protein